MGNCLPYVWAHVCTSGQRHMSNRMHTMVSPYSFTAVHAPSDPPPFELGLELINGGGHASRDVGGTTRRDLVYGLDRRLLPHTPQYNVKGRSLFYQMWIIQQPGQCQLWFRLLTLYQCVCVISIHDRILVRMPRWWKQSLQWLKVSLITLTNRAYSVNNML